MSSTVQARQARDERKSAASATPRVGFVSLGCPKALVDSEQVLTQLRAEGYEIAPSYESADLVVVNTCGFIDSAVAESLDAIGEALHENGKVIVTGCLGARENGSFVRAAHPKVLAVTGPHATAEVMSAVHEHLPKPHDPFVDLVPPQGIKLTPSHYAYLKISEGCNHRCTFCIIPSLRGDLKSRPIGEVLLEAERLLKAGVRELLVVSQDTSAYGVDVKYRTGFWQGRPLRTHMTELASALDALGRAHRAWVRLHYVYPYPHVDEVVTRMTTNVGEGGLLPYLDVPFQHASPRILKLMKRPAAPEKVLDRIAAWRRERPEITAAPSSSVFPEKRKANSRRSSTFSMRRSSIASDALRTRRSRARPRTRFRIPSPTASRKNDDAASWKSRGKSARRSSRAESGRRSTSSSTRTKEKAVAVRRDRSQLPAAPRTRRRSTAWSGSKPHRRSRVSDRLPGSS